MRPWPGTPALVASLALVAVTLWSATAGWAIEADSQAPGIGRSFAVIAGAAARAERLDSYVRRVQATGTPSSGGAPSSTVSPPSTPMSVPDLSLPAEERELGGGEPPEIEEAPPPAPRRTPRC